MKKILFLAFILSFNCALSQEASSEVESSLNYNYVGAGYSRTSYKDNSGDLTAYSLTVSKGLTENVFIGGGYENGSKDKTNLTATMFSIGAGFHTPIYKNVDVIISGEIASGDVKTPTTYSASGNMISLGVRGLITPKLEGSVKGSNVSVSVNSTTTTTTETSAQLGFNATDNFQVYAGVNFKSDQTVGIGLKLFY